MRFTIVSNLAIAAFFSSCAHEGVTIGKRFRPMPSAEPLEVNATYTLELRDSAGQIHSQMVTADVFARYEVGDYFSDLQPFPPPANRKDFEEIQQLPVPAENQGPFRPQVYLPVKTTRVHHRRKDPARIVKAQHGVRHSAKIARTNHRTTRHRKVAETHKVRPRAAQT